MSPGKKVEAWTYNGVVPGPTIQVNSGDKVAIKLKNELPESTTIHWHGITVPNAMDGVPDITQPPIKPGETFTYTFTAQGPAVGIYHSHDHAETQVPNGLFAPFLIDDVAMPAGVTPTQRIPMVLNDTGDDRSDAERQVVPRHRADRRQLRRVGADRLPERRLILGHPMHLHGMPQTGDRQGRVLGAPALPGGHDLGGAR